MGLFKGLRDFFRRSGDLAEGALNNAVDKMMTANEHTIRAQFRKVKEDLMKNYNAIKSSLSGLMVLRDQKVSDNEKLKERIDDLEKKKIGAVRLYNETQEFKYKDAFNEFSIRVESIKKIYDKNDQFIQSNSASIDKLKEQLYDLQSKLDQVKIQEDQTVADIISARQVEKINSSMSGITGDVNTDSLNVIEQARLKALARAKLAVEIGNGKTFSFEKELEKAGHSYDEEFEKLCQEEKAKASK